MNRDAFKDEDATGQLLAEIERDREDAEFEVVAGLVIAGLIGIGLALS